MTTHTRGSTLIEMIVVLVLVAFLFGAALPAMTAVPDPLPGASTDSVRWAAISSGAVRRGDSLAVLPDGRSLVRGGRRAR